MCVVAHKCPFLRPSSLKVPVLFGFATVQYVSVSPVSEQAQICVGTVDSTFPPAELGASCYVVVSFATDKWISVIRPV